MPPGRRGGQDLPNELQPSAGAAALPSAVAPSLPRNVSWALLGNVVYAGCQWAMLVFLTKLTPPAVVGRFGLALAVTAPVLIFSGLSLRAAQATDARGEYAFGHYLALRLGTTALALLGVAGIALHGYRTETALVILAVGLAKAIESVSDILYGLLQQRECLRCVACSLIWRGLLSLVALGGCAWLTRGVLWGTLAMAAVWAGVLLAYDLPNGQRLLAAESSPAHPLRPRWEVPVLARLAWSTLPLGAAAALLALNASIPRYVLERRLGEGALGIFTAMASLMSIGSTLVNAVGQGASPRLAKHYAAGDRRAFLALLAKLVGLAALLGAAGILAALTLGRPLLARLFRPEYAVHTDLFTWVMVAAAGLYLAGVLGVALNAMRSFRDQAVLQALNVLLVGSLSLALIPRHGLVAGAWTLALGALFLLAGYAALVARALLRSAPSKP